MRYSHINFRPPAGARKAAKRGLELRKKFHRGGLSSKKAGKLGIGSGIVRAVNISKGSKISPDTVRRMKNYFTRHQKDKRPGWGNPGNPTNGYIAWMLWGGDPGFAWAKKIVKQMENEDKRSR
ncbi:hypothetical protein GF336_04625 [Candidatus Woesearchaeota archaeon]|nr:hypothetical protein [Candidatus Woesearchaeota archaeon]